MFLCRRQSTVPRRVVHVLPPAAPDRTRAAGRGPPGQRHRLHGARLAGPQPLPAASLTIQRKVSSRGGIQVARQRIQVGFPHAGQVVTIQLGDTTLRVTGQDGELTATVPRASNGEISRFEAYGTRRQPR